MEFVLGRIFAKFYICQILNSTSYSEVKRKKLELEQLIEENMLDMNNEMESNLNKDCLNIGSMKSNRTSLASNLIDENPQYKRYFMYKNIIYSKVEIQGIVIEKTRMGYEEKKNVRFLIYIDDTTGVIQAISWLNKSDAVFRKIEKELSPGKFIRVLGQIDNFLNSFEIIIENFEIIKNFQTELLFHQTLQKNQLAIQTSDIFNLLDLDNNIYVESNDKNKYALQKKDFANRMLAFFQRYSINKETVHDGFLELDIKELFKLNKFNLMLEEFCSENKIKDQEKFFRECFSLLREHSMGSLDENGIMEIRVDNTRIREDILKLIRSSKTGITYIELFDEISSIYQNFFMNDYIKFILGQLVDEILIMADQNKYFIA